MNMQNLMAQARKLQSEMQNIQKEIENTLYETEKQGVKVSINGNLEMKSICIIDNNLLTDEEILQDVIVLAVNETLEKIKKDKKAKLGKYSGGMEGLF